MYEKITTPNSTDKILISFLEILYKEFQKTQTPGRKKAIALEEDSPVNVGANKQPQKAKIVKFLWIAFSVSKKEFNLFFFKYTRYNPNTNVNGMKYLKLYELLDPQLK